MKADIYDTTGKKTKQIDLPDFFTQKIRPDLIKRAFLHEVSFTYQPKGVDPSSGFKTSAEYLGRKGSYRAMKNRGQAKLPRVKLPEGRFGDVRTIPSSVGGRRAHPPVPEKKLVEQMNKREYLFALMNSLAATTNVSFVKKRGHKFDGSVPIVLSEEFEKIEKTKDLNSILSLFIKDDLERSKKGTKKTNARAVKSRTYVPRSLLIITDQKSNLLKTARNISGVDVVPVEEINVSLLAPGGVPGRLTAFTQPAIKKLDEIIKIKG
ncbi:50S ribosomal protein L4 [Candidatus Micrarchaeota archaeon]|nr:50S ribosomal protein L4 [Candidatus Micrarchaeota archaeon]